MAQTEAAAPTSSGVSASLAALDAALGQPGASPVAFQPAPAAPAPAAAPPPAVQFAQPQQTAPQALPVPQPGFTPAAAQPPQGAPAAQPGTPAAAPPQIADGQDEPPLVPSFRLRQETDKRREAENAAQAARAQNRQLSGILEAILAAQGQPQAQAQPPAQPQAPTPPQFPDLIDRPLDYAEAVRKAAIESAQELVRQETAPIMQQLIDERVDRSWDRAVSVHGQELASAATYAAQRAGLEDQFKATTDPVGNAVAWYQKQVAERDYGTDPTTIQTRVEQQLMQDPAKLEALLTRARELLAAVPGQQQPAPQAAAPAQPQAQPQRQPVAMPPPSFAGQPRAQGAYPVGSVASTADAVNAFFTGRKQSWSGPPGQAAF